MVNLINGVIEFMRNHFGTIGVYAACIIITFVLLGLIIFIACGFDVIRRDINLKDGMSIIRALIYLIIFIPILVYIIGVVEQVAGSITAMIVTIGIAFISIVLEAY